MKEDETMDTKVYQSKDLNKKHVQQHIKNTINSHRLVVFPTETVYGIGANALDSISVLNIFKAKGRPSDNQLIVHISKITDLEKYAKDIPPFTYQLTERFWPGPLTLVLYKKDVISDVVTGGLDSVAIRMPNHPVALKVIDISCCPICAPSANISGKPSSTEFSHVEKDFNGIVDIMIDGGKTNIGIESTVLDLTSDIPTILRPGYVTKEMIESVLNCPILEAYEEEIKETPKSPGMKYKHYAPKAELYVIKGDMAKVIEFLNDQIHSNQKKVGIICPKEYCTKINTQHYYDLGSISDLDMIASHIYSAFRYMDEKNVDIIYIPYLPLNDQGKAIMNRVLKAANQKVINI